MKIFLRIFPVFVIALVFINPLLALDRTLEDPYVLATKLKHAKNDIEKASLLLDLAEVHLEDNAVRSLGKTKLALVLARNNKNAHIQFRALTLLIEIYTDYINDGQIAGDYLKKIKELPQEILNDNEIAKSFLVEGQVFVSLSDYPKAQQAFFKARDYYKNLGSKNALYDVNHRLGLLNYNRDDFVSALVYFNQAYIGFKEIDNQDGEIATLKMLGLSNIALNEERKAMEYLNKGVQLSQTIDNQKLLSELYLVFTKYHFEKGDYKTTVKYLNKAIEVNEIISVPVLNAEIEKYLGLIALNKCEEEKANEHLTKALTFIEKSNQNKIARDIYKKMYAFHLDNGNDAMAFVALQNLTRWNETVYNEDKARQLITNRVRYESEKVEEENENLKANGLQIMIALQQQRTQNFILIFISLLVLGGMGFFYYSYRQKKIYNLSLEKIVVDRTEELRQSNLKLSEMNEKLGDSNTELERFAYIASHDLKSPLRNIISFIGLTTRKLKGSEDQEIHEYLQYVRTNAEQMNDLIRDILEFSKVEKGASEKIEVDSNISLCHAVQNITTLIDTKNAKVSSDVLPNFFGKNSQVIQLFQNLIGNGIKYNQSSQPHIDIKYTLVGDNHQIDIIDNGIGISDEYKEKVFDMFSRLHTKEEYNGTGIGLAVCKKIVKKLGGEIWLTSDEGKGTTFSFTVPALAIA